MNEVIKNILTRRSVRVYKDEQISDQDLNVILEAAQFAPSTMNAQDWHFTVVQNKEKIEKLNLMIKEAFLNSSIDHLKKQGSDPNFNVFYKAPTLVIASGDKVTNMEQVDCALALQNIFLAAHSLKIGSCWIHALNIIGDDPKIRGFVAELGIPENYTVYGTAILGFNGGNEPSARQRKEGTINIVK